jgi:hypothetical protein
VTAAHSARFSFAYFSLAKQRKVSGRRATPGQHQQQNPTIEINSEWTSTPGRDPANEHIDNKQK